MKKLVVIAFACLLPVGCGEREQDMVISKTVQVLGSVSETLTGVTKEVQDALKLINIKAGEQLTAEPVKLEADKRLKDADKHITDAIKRAEGLRKLGDELQYWRVRAENLKDKTSASMRDQLLEQHRTRLVSDLIRLDKQYQELETVLAEATAHADDSAKVRVADLRKEVNGGRDAFDLLNKVR